MYVHLWEISIWFAITSNSFSALVNQKLDGEIRDTKARMANKLMLVSPGPDKDLAMSSVSNGLGCDDHVQYPSKKEQGQACDGETLQDSGDHFNVKIHDPPFSDFVESSVGNTIHR
jgi:hypothetical protein